ncbi:NINE protein [Jejuia pallidilutea]|jgi:TM2 domain-containing membrane protein YozV|uniref:TM2 domain-containing membrane protein YozV n=1 Tax=Jejuia pallidilutea TaxID=504487 RepID=A0A098LM49_9FLAO|nr:NINE protein [Jejuia pallidilutea]PQV46021.1 TM2 domain-containing membrane protein YozV [Jejuia pallidilutea]GAL88061.1 Tsr1131 protein [Jejuia pallidilutea]
MSDEKNLSDDLDDMLGDAKDSAKKTTESAKEKAKEFANEAKETASEFSEAAKETFASGENKKILAGILAILVGWLGIHKFILGYNKEGGILLGVSIIGIVLSCVGIGVLVVWVTGLIGLVEGIIYLTKSDADFYNTYQVGKKPWF